MGVDGYGEGYWIDIYSFNDIFYSGIRIQFSDQLQVDSHIWYENYRREDLNAKILISSKDMSRVRRGKEQDLAHFRG